MWKILNVQALWDKTAGPEQGGAVLYTQAGKAVEFMLKKGLAFMAITAAVLGAGVSVVPVGALSAMAPYEEMVSTDTFYNGAMLELKRNGDVSSWITSELTTMKKDYNINTVNLYGLESFRYTEKLFAELKRLGMQAVVRIESYSQDFAFREEDLPYIMNVYGELLDLVCRPEYRDQVAYFSLNMPVDDPRVQQNTGGLNSEKFVTSQVTYAEAFVKRMREETARRGFTDAQMYLSIFYGWDNSFKVPSYASAGADGYFMNNYTYPKNDNNIPDETASDTDLINRARLSISVSKFLKDYPDKPLVVEFGFHTLEYNGGKKPNQTAGLVANKAAKARAIKATLDYYREAVPNFRGALYFGYNLYKEEGNPPAVMDWTLNYPDGDAGITTITTAKPVASTTVATEATAPTQNEGIHSPETSGTQSQFSSTSSMETARTSTSASESRLLETGGNEEKNTGMPLANKIALGVLGVLTAVLGGLVAFWLVLRRKAGTVG